MTSSFESLESFERVEPADRDLVRTIEQLLDSHGGSERDPVKGIAFDAALWQRLTELGLTRLTGEESAGGSGAGWREAAALLGAAATRAVSLPLAEHDLLAGWLLERAGLAMDERVRTVAVLDRDGRCRAVPWASAAECVVTVRLDGDTARLADVATSSISITPGHNLLGEPRDDVVVDGMDGVEIDPALAGELTLRGGLVRAVQVTAALERILDLTVQQVQTRIQFGRPLARFQAVQHQLADIAAEVALARSCVDAAIHAADADPARLDFLVPVARSCAGHAATVAVRHGHQLHGAIGTTQEHELHRHTLAALSWRSEYGSTQAWDTGVAAAARAHGAEGLWPLVTGVR